MQTSKGALGATCFNSALFAVGGWSESSIDLCKDHGNGRQGLGLRCTCTHLFLPVSCSLPAVLTALLSLLGKLMVYFPLASVTRFLLFQWDQLRTGSFLKEHILFCRTLQLPTSLKESPKCLPMAWSPSSFALNSFSFWGYFHQDDTATSLTAMLLSFLGCSRAKVRLVADCLGLYHCMAAVLSDTETQRAPFRCPDISSSCS